VPLLIRSFLTARQGVPALREHRLVIAGGRWWRGTEEQVAAAGSDRVHFLGRVSDDIRSRLLAGASALAYLSLFEGFGLPPLEAMAHGTPVLASSLTSLPEVCGAGALLVDPRSPAAVLDGLVSVLTDETVRTRLRRAGPQIAGSYDVDRVGRAVLEAFRHATGTTPAAVATAGPSRSERGTG
jgi:glycosyltransferase involved in cell wall biosynthesis